VRRSPIDPHTQGQLGTPEMVGCLKAALIISQEASQVALVAWEQSPRDPQLQRQMITAMVAEGRAEHTLTVAKRSLSGNIRIERELKAAARRPW